MKKTLIATTLVATAAAGTTVLVAGPASADVERRGTCAGATYELNVDRERGGYDVDADIENARAFSEWTVAVRHDGKVAVSRTLEADDDRVELVVEDAGPGLPTGLDATGRGESGSGSTGLGLSIATRTAEDSGGAITTGASDMGGARVSVTLRTD